jgi:LysR family transcriptional regulator, nitrogen assimilation regulatory protein
MSHARRSRRRAQNPVPVAFHHEPVQSPKASDFKIDIAADLHKWRAFVAIGELGSLTRAALFLDSNQSLLSRQLNALERECGARLFNRTGRGVELSEIGTRLFPRVKALLVDAERLEAEIRGEAREPSGRVTVGLLPSIGLPLVGRLFAQVRSLHASVSLKILEGSSGQVEEWLSDARVDIAILYRYGPTLPETERSLAVVDSYLIGACGDRVTAQAEVTFDSLHDLPFILPAAPNGLRTALDTIARQRHITLAPAIEADSLPLQKALVAGERLYTVLPLHAVWNEVAEGRLQASHIVDPPFQRTISMVLAKSKGPARAVSAVASQIGEIVADMAGAGMWRAGGGRPAVTPVA